MSYYVTTPIYYVNAEPHLGHAYTTLACDVLARHMRQRGQDVFFLTGTDEHGEPVAQAADQQDLSPRQLADKNSVRFRDLTSKLDITNDFFIRTTDSQHVGGVQEVLRRVYEAGYVYEGTYEGWYCPRCADFKSEAELDAEGRCPIHKLKLEKQTEDNYFFKLSAFQEPLERLYQQRPDFVRPRERYNEALAFIKQGLTDISLSRSSLSWGVPVPWDPAQVFYVWFDALLNYYTALSYARPDQDLLTKFWPPTVHVMAKDILKFHAVIWPALLMAAELSLPNNLFVHGYLLMEREKMSKSLGNVIDPFQVIDTYGTDALRFYLFREVTFGYDGSVSAEGFETRYTTELANEYGNLASRTTAMVLRYRDGIVPDVKPPAALGADFDGLAERVCEHFDRVEITQAIELIWQRIRRLNQYVQDVAPWQLAKDENRGSELDEALYGLSEGLRTVSVLLHPILPNATEQLLEVLGESRRSVEAGRFGAGQGGMQVRRLQPLFPRVENFGQVA
jgi:methionyl-tRNA synthetase